MAIYRERDLQRHKTNYSKEQKKSLYIVRPIITKLTLNFFCVNHFRLTYLVSSSLFCIMKKKHNVINNNKVLLISEEKINTKSKLQFLSISNKPTCDTSLYLKLKTTTFLHDYFRVETRLFRYVLR